MTEYHDFLTPVGRIVQGSVSRPRTTDMNKRPLVYMSGEKKGQPREDYFFAIACSKADPAANEFKQKIEAFGRSCWPGKPVINCKVIDGDSNVPNQTGKPPCEYEGFPGHWVFKFNGSRKPRCFSIGGREPVENEFIKTGYFVRVHGNMNTNKTDAKPGIFLNHSWVELVGYGAEIITGPSADEVFASPIGYTPEGMSQTPVAPTPPPQAQAPVVPPPQQAPTPPPQQAPTPPPQQAPTPPPQPNYQILQPPTPKERTFLIQGQEYTETQLRVAGWQDADIEQAAANEIPF